MSLLSGGSISLYGSGFSLALVYPLIQGFPGISDGKEFTCNAGDPDSIPGSGRSPREENGKLVFLPGEFHGPRSLAGYSPWGLKELDRTEWLILPLFFHLLTQIWNSKVSKNLLTESVGFTFSFTNGDGQEGGLQQREGRVCGQTTESTSFLSVVPMGCLYPWPMVRASERHSLLMSTTSPAPLNQGL